MTEICTATTLGAAEAVEAAIPHARAEERTAMEAQLIQLQHNCAHGDPAVVARGATRLARLAGRIEARANQPRPASL
ncbi:hypothetical protein [Sediminicoccus sp. KRV36]|uniref:hypothetical protein n=1 Tax=Sediminicoccus sp. KRV36 TaxID=3133721 RepID=UPI00200CC058|nr:hypothetical protein [Sediminicoccus rosea]UPY35211.1 hypothetical protein LHU95_13320 [Sediminicoccus rosea]